MLAFNTPQAVKRQLSTKAKSSRELTLCPQCYSTLRQFNVTGCSESTRSRIKYIRSIRLILQVARAVCFGFILHSPPPLQSLKSWG